MPAKTRALQRLSKFVTSREHRSFLISLAIHTAVLTLLVWFTIPQGTRSFVLSLSMTTCDAEPAAVTFESPLTLEPPPPADDSSEMPLTNVDAWGTNESAVTFTKLSNSIPSTRQPLEFFGSQAYGNRFVFVLDVSRSMDARDNERIDRARYELIRSVSSLRPSQEFSVILFSYRTILMFNDRTPRYLFAEADQISKLKAWLFRIKLLPGTDPRRALSIAHSLKPDAVFFLTDGDFNQGSGQGVGWLNESGKKDNCDVKAGIARYYSNTPIHCIAFENPFTFKAMQEIGVLTDGSARYVKTCSYNPVNKALFKSESLRLPQNASPDSTMIRLTVAKTLIAAGELVYADCVSRPLRQGMLTDAEQPLADEIFDILDRELTAEARKLTDELIEFMP